MAQKGKPPPGWQHLDMGADLSLDAPLLIQLPTCRGWLMSLGPCNHVGDLEEGSGLDPALDIVPT